MNVGENNTACRVGHVTTESAKLPCL